MTKYDSQQLVTDTRPMVNPSEQDNTRLATEGGPKERSRFQAIWRSVLSTLAGAGILLTAKETFDYQAALSQALDKTTPTPTATVAATPDQAPTIGKTPTEVATRVLAMAQVKKQEQVMPTATTTPEATKPVTGTTGITGTETIPNIVVVEKWSVKTDRNIRSSKDTTSDKNKVVLLKAGSMFDTFGAEPDGWMVIRGIYDAQGNRIAVEPGTQFVKFDSKFFQSEGTVSIQATPQPNLEGTGGAVITESVQGTEAASNNETTLTSTIPVVLEGNKPLTYDRSKSEEECAKILSDAYLEMLKIQTGLTEQDLINLDSATIDIVAPFQGAKMGRSPSILDQQEINVNPSKGIVVARFKNQQDLDTYVKSFGIDITGQMDLVKTNNDTDARLVRDGAVVGVPLQLMGNDNTLYVFTSIDGQLHFAVGNVGDTSTGGFVLQVLVQSAYKVVDTMQGGRYTENGYFFMNDFGKGYVYDPKRKYNVGGKLTKLPPEFDRAKFWNTNPEYTELISSLFLD